MTSIRSAAGTGLPTSKDETPNWPKRQEELFEQRHADLLKVRAELAACEIGLAEDDESDIKHFEISLRRDDAERLVMTTHAIHGHHLWQKIAVFEHALHGHPDSDQDRRDNKKVWMFGCIKADMISLGVGRKGAL